MPCFLSYVNQMIKRSNQLDEHIKYFSLVHILCGMSVDSLKASGLRILSYFC